MTKSFWVYLTVLAVITALVGPTYAAQAPETPISPAAAAVWLPAAADQDPQHTQIMDTFGAVLTQFGEGWTMGFSGVYSYYDNYIYNAFDEQEGCSAHFCNGVRLDAFHSSDDAEAVFDDWSRSDPYFTNHLTKYNGYTAYWFEWDPGEFQITVLIGRFFTSAHCWQCDLNQARSYLDVLYNAGIESGLFASGGLEILLPSPANPAYAGSLDVPEKFWVIVSKVADGLGRSDFAVEVGGQAAQVTGFVEQVDSYKLEVYPSLPTSSSSSAATAAASQSRLSLTVKAVGVSGVPTASVENAVSAVIGSMGTGDTAMVLCMDVSKSMAWVYSGMGRSVTKLRMAKDAGAGLIMAAPSGWQVGLVDYSAWARRRYALSRIPDDPNGDPAGNATRRSLVASLEQLGVSGWTSIGAGLQSADAEMQANADPDAARAIVLLTDGDENRAPWVAEILPTLDETIYPIAFGDDPNWPLLRAIARASGTTLQYVRAVASRPTVSSLGNSGFPDLTGAYLSALAAMQRDQLLFQQSDSASAGVTYTHTVSIDPCSEALFLLSWLNGQEPLSLVLQSPTGALISGPTTSAGEFYAESDTLNYFRIQEPLPGEWILHVEGSPQVGSAGQPYTIQTYGGKARGMAPTTMVGQPPEGAPLVGQPLHIAATLTDSGPIAATVSALVEPVAATASSRLSDVMTLYDDGAHGDGRASDGLYANAYTSTGLAGAYSVRIEATGTNNEGQAFRREVRDILYVGEPLEMTVIPPGFDTVQPHDVVTFTIHYEDLSGFSLTGVAIDVVYDPQLAFLSASPSPDAGDNHWDIGELASGSCGVVEIVCRVGEEAAVGADLTLQALADSDQTEPLSSSASVRVSQAPIDSGLVLHVPLVLDLAHPEPIPTPPWQTLR